MSGTVFTECFSGKHHEIAKKSFIDLIRILEVGDTNYPHAMLADAMFAALREVAKDDLEGHQYNNLLSLMGYKLSAAERDYSEQLEKACEEAKQLELNEDSTHH